MSSIFKTAATTTAKTAAKTATRTVAKVAVKNAITTATKTAARRAAIASYKAAAKNVAKQISKNVAKRSSNFIKSGGKNAKVLLKKATQTASAARKSLTNFIAKNPKLVIGGVAAAAVGGFALDKFLKLNDKTYKIISINPHTVGGVLGFGSKMAIKIEYHSQGDKLRVNDTIVITDSNSSAIADGGYIIQGVNNTANPPFLIANYGSDDPEKMPVITKPATDGNMMYKTTFESQLVGVVSETAESIGKTAGGVISDIGGNVIDSVFPGISEYTTPILIFIFLVILIILLSYVKPILGGSELESTDDPEYSIMSDISPMFI